MGEVLTTKSIIKCTSAPTPGKPAPSEPVHGGEVVTTSTSKLKVNGEPVLLRNDIGPAVSGCKTSSSASTEPCTSATVTGGEATKLKVGITGVMLADQLTGTTVGPPPGILTAEANQTKLTAI
ncbi:hypothetical protein N836_24150 [Leptolyngbya sp. Heron Island J]|uniref:hypothetical protein n=1 Tax=Leptolyngbya sp. Heron Island J TaxID=1385935 RepID=UPI0003B9E617|nr:hypothetical protein [Leptolyngbya sp. Heron Island J]ESA32883.1 hypothetical protein N836_24150 [Leptolyngbya sp. Heron Island J]